MVSSGRKPRFAALGTFINETVDASPELHPADLTKWPRDLPTPPDVSAEQVEVFRQAAISMAAAAVAAEALHIGSARTLLLLGDRDVWKAWAGVHVRLWTLEERLEEVEQGVPEAQRGVMQRLKRRIAHVLERTEPGHPVHDRVLVVLMKIQARAVLRRLAFR